MLRTLLQLFESNVSESEKSHTVELATAALLSEIMRADAHVDDAELAAYKAQLYARFSLSQEALNALADEGRASAEDAVDLVQFTQVINENCDSHDKQQIVKGLWEVAYADKSIAPIEEHTIRRIADLLHVPHSQFIKAKLSVTGDEQ
ncbi:TerB family tellurite resistance protein [Alteromonas sp. 345S023]|uniref:TerB family tellurite resistance protein n=1 Tax=Alteromonas profundi TaxID=2696062 RepID=A0A7X5LKR1_9ALTE|nr:TerB family tellurite resistance protein [Alteromonas profundi]NDV91163.1 TerB family tellurite resistance protein [Alteromonas profundi]